MRTKYMTVVEYTKENGANNIGKILVLSEHDIDIMIKNRVFRLDGRQVWYGGDVKVFPQMLIEFPKDAHMIKIPKLDYKEMKYFR